MCYQNSDHHKVTFSWGQNLLRNRVLWCIWRWFLSHLPARSLRGFFSNIYCKDLVDFLKVNFTVLWAYLSWVPWSFIYDSVCTEPPAIQLQFIAQLWFLPDFFLSLFSDKPLFPLFIFLSNMGGSVLFCVLLFLLGLKRIDDFLVCSAIYLLLGYSGDFQSHYMLIWNQKTLFTLTQKI